MKKLLLIAVGVLAAMNAYAQGTINFGNRITAAGIDAPIRTSTGDLAIGPNVVAQLYAGATDASLAAVGSPVALRGAGAGAGYFPTQSGMAIAGLAPGSSARVQIRAFDTTTGATWDAATSKGQGNIVSVTLGGAGAPPTLPVDPVGWTGFALSGGGGPIIPEPSTVALAVLGGVAALYLRRRKE